MLKAGMAQADITPPEGLELAGYPHYPRYNKGAHDRLWAACMYLTDGGEEAVMVTLDLLFFSKKHTAEARRRLEESGVIAGSRVMISTSHTHSGPWASGRLDIESLEAGKKQPKTHNGVSGPPDSKPSPWPGYDTACLSLRRRVHLRGKSG